MGVAAIKRQERLAEVEEVGVTPGKDPLPVEFDRDSALTWATYVMGYVEGCARSRTHILAERTERAR